MSALVAQESTLLAQAFEISRENADRRAVDSLFARVQALQVERNSLQKRISNLLGIQRLDLNLTPVGRETLPSEILSGEIGGTITLRTSDSNNLPVGIYSLIATFR